MKLYKHLIYLIGFGTAFMGIIGFIFTYITIFLYGKVGYEEPNPYILTFELLSFIIGFICLSWIAWNTYLKGE